MEKYNSIKPSILGLLSLIGFLIPSHSFAWEKIVVLNPMIAEWTAEILGKEKAQKKIVGASEYSNYPEYMKTVPTIGPYPQIQIEKVLSLNPDLVIGSTEYNRQDQLERLRKLKLNVQTVPKENFMHMESWIMILGKILGEDAASKKVALAWNKASDEIQTPKNKKKAFFQIQFQPLITVGKDSFLNDAFRMVGYENVFSTISQSYPKVSREAAFSKKPEVVFVFEMVKEREDIEKIKLAWKNSKIQILNGDDFSRCSPRLLKALKEVSSHE